VRDEAPPLLLLRQVEEELDDAGAVGVQVSFQVGDRTIAVAPERLLVARPIGKALGL